MGTSVAVIGKREPAIGVTQVGYLGDSIRASGVVNLHAITKAIAFRHQRTHAAQRRAKDGRIAINIPPGKASGGGTSERAKNPNRIRIAVGATGEHQPQA